MAAKKIKAKGKSPEKAKSDLEEITGRPVVQPILYTHDRGRVSMMVREKPFIFERNLNRILDNPDPSEFAVGMGRLWCDGQYNSEELMTIIPQMIAEGMQIKDILEKMPQPMPGHFTVSLWERKDPKFKDNMEAARSARAELMLDAATDRILSITDEDDAKIAKAQAEHMRWMAERLNQKFTKTTNVNMEDKTPVRTAQETEARFERMLKHPVIGPYLVSKLKTGVMPGDDLPVLEVGEL